WRAPSDEACRGLSLPRLPPDAFRRSVHVEPGVTKDSHAPPPETLGPPHREARRRTDRGEDRDPRGPRLLPDLVAGPSTHREHRTRERQPAVGPGAGAALVRPVLG